MNSFNWGLNEMKMKLLLLFLMCLMIFSVVPPISAANIGDSKITGPHEKPLTNIRVHDGNSIELNVKLYEYWRMAANQPQGMWFAKSGKRLNFNLYKENPDGTNGQLVWSDIDHTSLFTATVTIRFLYLQKGNYNLDIDFDDLSEDKEKPCSTSIKIDVVGKHHL